MKQNGRNQKAAQDKKQIHADPSKLKIEIMQMPMTENDQKNCYRS